MNLLTHLAAKNASTRLNAALKIGSNPEPDPTIVDALVDQCAIESDFYVRDMLTWALTRFPDEITVPRLIAELSSDCAQARSQALHTLSKVRDPSVWPAIPKLLLHDPEDDVARSAWRAAVVLVPEGERAELASELAMQLGRGSRDVQLSLSLALVALGADLVEAIARSAGTKSNPRVRAHAEATLRLLRDPDAGFELSIQKARRAYVLGKERQD